MSWAATSIVGRVVLDAMSEHVEHGRPPDPALLEPVTAVVAGGRCVLHPAGPDSFDLAVRRQSALAPQAVLELDQDVTVLVGLEVDVGHQQPPRGRATW